MLGRVSDDPRSSPAGQKIAYLAEPTTACARLRTRWPWGCRGGGCPACRFCNLVFARPVSIDPHPSDCQESIMPVLAGRQRTAAGRFVALCLLAILLAALIGPSWHSAWAQDNGASDNGATPAQTAGTQ